MIILYKNKIEVTCAITHECIYQWHINCVIAIDKARKKLT